jgi:hypothetical protein
MTTPDLPMAELRAAITKLLDVIELKFGPDLHLVEDLYWNVPLGAATAVHVTPELDMGSVVDDAESVHEFLTPRDDAVVSIWHESDHLAGVLRSIARLDLSTK